MQYRTFRHRNYPLTDGMASLARKAISPERPELLHDHDYFEVCWIVGGRGLHFVNHHVHRLSRGDVLWIRPNDLHGFQSRKGHPMELVNLSLNAALVRQLQALCPPELQVRTFWSPELIPEHGRASKAVSAALARLAQAAHSEDASRLSVTGALAVVLDLWRHRESALADDTNAWLADACRRTETLGKLDSTALPSVSEFVQACGRGHAHVCRTMQSLLGKTPSQYLNEVRCKRANRLLRETRLSVEEIGFRCGFESLSYFSKTYKKSQGLSPSAFRQAAFNDPLGNSLTRPAGSRTST